MTAHTFYKIHSLALEFVALNNNRKNLFFNNVQDFETVKSSRKQAIKKISFWRKSASQLFLTAILTRISGKPFFLATTYQILTIHQLSFFNTH